MKKNVLLVVFILSVTLSFSQNNAWKLWDDSKVITSERVKQTPYSENQKLVQFNAVQFKQALANVPQEASGQAGVEIQLPNINGELEKFVIWESSNFEPELQAQHPDIRAFVGKGVKDPSAKLHFSFSPIGIQTMVIRPDLGSEFIEAYTKDKSVYVIFDSKTRISGGLPFNCSTDDSALTQSLSNTIANRSNLQTYKTMRLALSCTGEYTTYFGGTVNGALAGMNATMTRVNAVMENDLAVKLFIIANNSDVIYLDAASDPYSDAAAGSAGAWNAELMNNLHSTLGDAAFDIGHLFGAAGGGGNAGCIGCVCTNVLSVGGNATNSYKGSGFTSPYDGIPAGDNFDIDYVVHEMGHQLGAQHTFSYGGINLNENTTVNVEPGSGSTIMGYAGVASPASCNVQAHSDAYYAFKSVSQIQTNLTTKTCPLSYTSASTPAYTNLKPTVSAGTDYTIPSGTPFKLTGIASDTAGEVLTYCWEQNDDATSIGATQSLPSPTKTDGPNFKSYSPTTSPVRYFPKLSDILNGQVTTTWETVSTVARNLNFSLTVRDNVLGGGQTNSDAMLVTVSATTGPFKVTSQSSAVNWAPGTTETITWDVNSTNTLTGAANVNIKLSIDGGLTYTDLLTNTPNDGTENITVPNVSSLNCRVMVEPTANVFFAINSKAFTIGATCNTFNISPNLAIADGTASNVAGATTTSVINVPVGLTISNMKINLKINHAKIGDLVVKIAHPDGTLRTLWNRTCNSATYSGIDLTFSDGTGSIVCGSPTSGTHNASQSSAALAGYNGKSSLGNWTLTVTDNNINNTGTLVSWGVDFGCTLATDEFALSDLAIYPNPNKGNFNIQFNNANSNEIKVNVYDMRGRMIFENKYSNQATFNENIQLNNAQSGVYLVSVTDGSQKIVKKIVVE